jgi:uncharacterized ion transporter superfamily protein YfcC
MKKLKFPSAQTILLIIAGFVAVLTWMVPAGKYATITYDAEEQVFLQKTIDKTTSLPATQETLDQLNIKIPLEKFTSGAIWKAINIPDTYRNINSKPQGVSEYILSPVKGIIAVADIIFLVLIIGGLVGIMNLTGAFNAGISNLAVALKGREHILIIAVVILIAAGGTTFGLAEETIAFYPILIPVFLAAKYDAMVAMASIYIGSSIGTMCATTNPFSTIIASDTAGIDWTSGLSSRIVMLALGTLICIIYILYYAKRVKKDPSKSVIFSQKQEIEKLFNSSIASHTKLTNKLRLILVLFTLCFVIMVYGVIALEWWFVEMTAVFLVGAIIIGAIARIKESVFVETFVKGAGELLGVALIIGIARGISILMEDGAISDTMLYYASGMTEGMHKGVFANVMLYIYGGLSFFIPSSSGMAVLTMPIMAPLADTVGIAREIMVNIYNYGMGLFAFINPTGLILPSLAVAHVGYDKWLKFVMPLFIILIVFTMIMITIAVYFP